jgi:glutamate dehydrogenase/leucine dehydrogenase
MGTSDPRVPDLMTLMQEELDRMIGPETAPGTFTGKPVQSNVNPRLNGVLRRDISTALGGQIVLQALRQKVAALGVHIGHDYIVQGTGNVGGNFAEMVIQGGERLVGVSNFSGGWYYPQGITMEQLRGIIAYDQKRLPLEEILPPNIDQDGLLLQKTDVLVPAAANDTITSKVVENFQGQVMLELANKAFSGDAEKSALDRERAGQLWVVPGNLANGGGVSLSNLESMQNRRGNLYTAQEAETYLREVMTRAAAGVYERSRRVKITLTEAAWQVSTLRLAEAMLER